MPERIARLVADAVSDEVMDMATHEAIDLYRKRYAGSSDIAGLRSEERRVGKEC